MKNEEQDITFSLTQPLCIFICYGSLISLFGFFFGNSTLLFFRWEGEVELLGFLACNYHYSVQTKYYSITHCQFTL